MSLVSVLIVYLIGMVLSSALIKILDVKGSVEFRGWGNEPNLSKIAIMVFLWPIVAVMFISLCLWAGLWGFILPKKE
ncbi:hypothetical protein PQC40_gp100 [Escherichia phage EP335]|uniref:Uncharacterized protein n=1 Tax=Escherichia phage EP335 TaxID=2070199 RepID=A0A2Z3DL01_9CAUD|nr:hypothetical protein PQC40_gp100 [Escherichia phage EP335]AVZ45183.1 hypothetical protein [Escherichia phage EP335]